MKQWLRPVLLDTEDALDLSIFILVLPDYSVHLADTGQTVGDNLCPCTLLLILYGSLLVCFSSLVRPKSGNKRLISKCCLWCDVMHAQFCVNSQPVCRKSLIAPAILLHFWVFTSMLFSFNCDHCYRC